MTMGSSVFLILFFGSCCLPRVLPAVDDRIAEASELVADSSDASKRRSGYFLLRKVAEDPKVSLSDRQAAVDLLVAGLSDGTETSRRAVANWITSVPEDGFSEKSKQSVRSLWQGSKTPFAAVLLLYRLKLLAVSDLKYLAAPVLADQSRIDRSKGAWAAVLVLARDGDPAAQEVVLKAHENEPRMWLRATDSFEDFAFVGSPETLAILTKALMSDEQLPEVDGNKFQLAQWAAAALGTAVPNFPIKGKKPEYFTKDDLEICRDWIVKNPVLQR